MMKKSSQRRGVRPVQGDSEQGDSPPVRLTLMFHGGLPGAEAPVTEDRLRGPHLPLAEGGNTDSSQSWTDSEPVFLRFRPLRAASGWQVSLRASLLL